MLYEGEILDDKHTTLDEVAFNGDGLLVNSWDLQDGENKE